MKKLSLSVRIASEVSKPVYEVEGELYNVNKLSWNSDFGQMILN